MIETADTVRLKEWLCPRLKMVPTPQLQVIGNVDPITNDILGVVGYDDYTGASCTVHAAGEAGWLSKTMLWVMFDYPFNQLNCNVILAATLSTNAHALKWNSKLGFKTECVLKGAHPRGDLVIRSLYKKDCKWLKRPLTWEKK